MSIIMNVSEVKRILGENGFNILNESRSGNDLATVLHLNNGCIVNCWDKGTVNFQGKNQNEVLLLFGKQSNRIDSSIVEKAAANTNIGNRKVFVVYGHDNNARTQLEAMLRRWDIEPIILDQLVSSGQTIIEKLEEYASQVNFAIVLATPDDMGHAKEHPDKIRHRARQNVVLELGMFLAKIGRRKVAILLSQAEDMEKPSDIDGLLYIPFKDNVEEAKLSLAKEMDNNGYNIDVKKL